MKWKVIFTTAMIVVLIASFLISTGFIKRTDVVLFDYIVAEDGSAISLDVQVSSSMGHTRGFTNKGGGIKPHYLTFYSTFGGLNSTFGKVNTFVLEIDNDDTEIYFNRPNGGYELVLIKNVDNGKWERPIEEQASQTATIGNPWSDWNTIEEAESVIGFSFGLPEVIADSYDAVSIRTLTDKLIEVVYRDDEFEVCVRKQKGEGQDISGDYNEYDTCTEENYNGGTITNYQNSNNNAVKQIISYKGYSWSLVAPNGYWGDSNQDFVSLIMEE